MRNTIVFFDDYMLREYEGVRRRIFTGRKIGELLPTREREIGGRMIRDPESGVYRHWRRELEINSDSIVNETVSESTDLREWTEMSADRLPKDVTFVPGHVTRDDFEPDPTMRYKKTHIERRPDNTGDGYIYTSPDGLVWTEHRDYHFCSHISDTANNVFYNQVLGGYQCILRGGFVERRIFATWSDDLISWSKPRCLMMPGPDEEPCVEYYGLVVFPQEGYFLGYLWKYLPPMYDSPSNRMAGKTDTFLVYSYDANCWNFVSDQPVVARPMPPQHGSTGIYLNSLDPGPDGHNWVLSGELRRIDHACGFKPAYPDSEIPRRGREEGWAATGLFEIRREGFAGLESNAMESRILFKRIVMQGDELLANLCAPLGWAKFQLRGKDGVIPGFSFDDCVPFADDDCIRHAVSWKNHSLSELRGQSVSLEIRMNTAIVFSVSGDFHVQPGNSPMISLGDTRQPTDEE